MRLPVTRGKAWAMALPRGVALFLGLFALLNLFGELWRPGFDANLWWINLPVGARYLDFLLLAWSAGCLLRFAVYQQLGVIDRTALTITFGILLAVSLWNAVTFYQLIVSGVIRSQFPIPFSAIVALCLLLVIWGVRWQSSPTEKLSACGYYGMLALSFAICGFLFPVGQMICFGMTDYRRSADVIVVFGAKVFPDGRLSSVLEERVRTGCDLYHGGFARHLVFSGGPGVGDIHETLAMRERAIQLGVPAAAIVVDPNGLDTDSTAENTLQLARHRKWRRILAVSQFFHLPRIKLAFHRHGSEVYTVPAVRLYHLRYLPYFMLREVAAWWVYYVRPLWTR